jgi:DNA polymerase (family X)
MGEYKLSNKDIIKLLKEALAAMEVKGANFFKIRAYQNAISILDGLTSSIYDIWENQNLNDVPGIGEGISHHLNELFLTGKVEEWIAFKKGLPDGMFSLLGLRSIGAKKAFKLADTFKLTDRGTAIELLKEHAKKLEIRIIPGFGEKSESQILEAIEQSKVNKSEKERTPLYKAEEIVARLLEYMRKLDCVVEIEACGSYRRRSATIGDLDIPVATTDPIKTMEHFLKYPEIGDISTKGDRRSTVILKNDIQVDLYVVAPTAYGSMVQYFTGSKQHNIVLRTYALDKGLSLSEHGIKVKSTGELKEFSTEKEFYSYLGLPQIPPEIRQGATEVTLAASNKLPHLVELKDIKGDLHIHTTDSSDAFNSLEDAIEKCISLGYEYIGISDHVPSIQTHGHAGIEKIIMEKKERIKKANEKYNSRGIKILYGYEVNILADAQMSWPDEFLKELDYAIGGVHSAFNQDKETMTKRIIAALENPYINFIAHPTNRLINEREGTDVDWRKIFIAAKENNKFFEINSSPSRLDLTPDLVRDALEMGIKLLINTDSHDLANFDLMKYGIDVARIGWCKKQDIINTYSFEDFVKILSVRNILDNKK